MKKTTYMTNVLVVLIVIVAASLMFINQPAEKTTVDIGYKKHVAYMPLFVAQEKGFFEQEGLIVNPVIFDSTNQMMAAVVSGDIDASLGGANLQTVFSIEEKSPNSMKVSQTLDVNENTGISCVMVKADSNIEELPDLEGKKSATIPGTFAPIWIDATLKTVGLSKEDIEIKGIDTKLQLSALGSGQVDVLFTLEPACSFGVNKGIGKIIYQEPLRHLGKSLTASIISEKLIQENPEVAAKIVTATDKSIDFIRNNPEESMAIMAKYADYSTESINGMKLPVYSKSNELDVESIQELADKLYAEGDLAKQLDIKGIVFK